MEFPKKWNDDGHLLKTIGYYKTDVAILSSIILSGISIKYDVLESGTETIGSPISSSPPP